MESFPAFGIVTVRVMFTEPEIQAVIAGKLRDFRVMDAPDEFAAKMLAQYVMGLINIALNVDGFAAYLDARSTLTPDECKGYADKIKRGENVPDRIRQMWETYLTHGVK